MVNSYHYVGKVLEKGVRGTCSKGYQPGKLKLLKMMGVGTYKVA